MFKMKVMRLFWFLFFPTIVLAQPNKKTTIVFVCEHGGARSTIASVYFNKMAKEQQLPYESTFRAIIPDSAITKETRNGLEEDGFKVSSLTPAVLNATDVGLNTLLISLDCTIPASYQTYRAWNGIPAISTDYSTARNEIIKKLNELINELKNKN
jgi:arsenate reductase (thioredoxin)